MLADWVAAQPGVTAVTASVEVGNIASRRLLERLGFVLVDTAEGHWQLARRPPRPAPPPPAPPARPAVALPSVTCGS